MVQQAELIERLQAEIADVRVENAELKRRLGQNSRNSSRPPSSDSPFTKPAPKSLRRKSGRKPGGQPGHPGATLVLVDNPNERKRHEPGVETITGRSGQGMARLSVPETQPIIRTAPSRTTSGTCHTIIGEYRFARSDTRERDRGAG